MGLELGIVGLTPCWQNPSLVHSLCHHLHRPRHLTPHETVPSDGIKGYTALHPRNCLWVLCLIHIIPCSLCSLHCEGWKWGVTFLDNLAIWVPVRLCHCKAFAGGWGAGGVEAMGAAPGSGAANNWGDFADFSSIHVSRCSTHANECVVLWQSPHPSPPHGI